MLKIEGLTKIFNKDDLENQKVALDNISLTINEGEFVTVIGGNGSGKSTLMNMICGVYQNDGGKIYLDNEDVTNLLEHKRAAYLGRVFQDPMIGTASQMSIEENLEISTLRGHKRGFRWGFKKEHHNEFIKYLEGLNLGLEKRLSQRVGLLSGGQRQAITLIMATINKPKLLLLDEHTAALDPKTASKVLNLTEKVINENHLTTLMITHNMRDAIKYGNRLIMLDQGKIVLDISGEEKKNLTVSSLIAKFEQNGDAFEISDKMIFSKN